MNETVIFVDNAVELHICKKCREEIYIYIYFISFAAFGDVLVMCAGIVKQKGIL